MLGIRALRLARCNLSNCPGRSRNHVGCISHTDRPAAGHFACARRSYRPRHGVSRDSHRDRHASFRTTTWTWPCCRGTDACTPVTRPVSTPVGAISHSIRCRPRSAPYAPYCGARCPICLPTTRFATSASISPGALDGPIFAARLRSRIVVPLQGAGRHHRRAQHQPARSWLLCAFGCGCRPAMRRPHRALHFCADPDRGGTPGDAGRERSAQPGGALAGGRLAADGRHGTRTPPHGHGPA